jgi:hypothetical protein
MQQSMYSPDIYSETYDCRKVTVMYRKNYYKNRANEFFEFFIFFDKGLDSKHFIFCEPQILYENYGTLTLQHESSHR